MINRRGFFGAIAALATMKAAPPSPFVPFGQAMTKALHGSEIAIHALDGEAVRRLVGSPEFQRAICSCRAHAKAQVKVRDAWEAGDFA